MYIPSPDDILVDGALLGNDGNKSIKIVFA
jgi:hypothetical protein